MDHADIAGKTIEVCQDDALRRALGKSGPDPYDPEFDGLHCVDCDEEIPGPRLVNGRVRCTFCQELLDRRAARGPV